MKNILLSPKDKVSIQHKSGIIYWCRCDMVDCNEEYFGVSVRTFGES